MRIQQTKVKPDWVKNSPDPAASLEAWIAGAPHEDLVDDQGLIVKVKPLEVVAPDKDTGIAFFAKDSETLIRGFSYLANSSRTKGKREFFLRERSASDLAALTIRWDKGVSRYSNSVAAALTTVGFNIEQFFRRGAARIDLALHPSYRPQILGNSGIEQYQSVSKNVDSVSRDSRMLQRGVAMYVCPSAVMPMQLSWGRTYRQIGDTMTFGMMTTVATRLFAK